MAIEPLAYVETTAARERGLMHDKINEIIEALNEIPVLENTAFTDRQNTFDTPQIIPHDPDESDEGLVDGAINQNKSKIEALATDKAEDDKVVHLAGAETITGAKTFKGSLYKNADMTFGQETTYKFGRMIISDNSNNVGATFIREENNVYESAGFSLLSYVTGSAVINNLKIYNDKTTHESYAIGPARLTGFGGQEITTVNFIRAFTEIVHTSGNESISGGKTFLNPLIRKKTDMTFGEETTEKYMDITYLDSEDKQGLLLRRSESADYERAVVGLISYAGTTPEYNYMYIQRDKATGLAHMEGPYPDTDDTSNNKEIVTIGKLKKLGLI